MLAQREVAQAPGVCCCVALMRRDDICPVPFSQLQHMKAQLSVVNPCAIHASMWRSRPICAKYHIHSS